MRSERVRKAFICLLLALAFAALPLRAGENVWTQIGPDGGTVTALAPHPTDPRIVYAGTRGGGIFKSTNGGRLWSAASQGLDNVFVNDLAIDPRSPDTLYAQAGFPGELYELYKSTDGGASWRRVGNGLPQVCCRHGQRGWVTLDPVRPNILYTGTSGGLYKSVDGGETWFWSNRGLGSRPTTDLAVDPASPDTLYVGAQRSIWKSVDGGATWFNSGTGMRGVVTELVIDPRRTRTVYAVTSEGLFKSTNAGASWQRLDSTPSSSVDTLAIDPLTPATLYAGALTGVFKSTNGGRSWRRVGEGLPTGRVGVLEVAPSAPHILFGGNGFSLEQGFGVFKSADAGEHWQIFPRGLTASVVTSLAASRAAPAILYAGTEGQGVFRSDNGGATWRAVNGGLGNLRVRGLAVDPTDPLTVYASVRDGGLFKTTDGGASWTARANGLTLFGPGTVAATAFSLVISPEDPSILLAGTIPGIYRSEDGAASWQLVKPFIPPTMVMEFAPSEPSVVYAAGYSWHARHPGPPQLFKSTDAGLSWVELPYPQPGDRRIPTFAVDPRDAGVVYLWTIGVLYRSSDGGATWAEVSRQDLYVTKLLFAPWNPEVMYASTDHGVYEITGGGSHWAPLNQGLKNSIVLDLIADPLSPGTLYAGTSGGGVYRLDRR